MRQPDTKIEVCSFSGSRDIEGSQNLKVSHVMTRPSPFVPNFYNLY